MEYVVENDALVLVEIAKAANVVWSKGDDNQGALVASIDTPIPIPDRIESCHGEYEYPVALGDGLVGAFSWPQSILK